ncbi:MAG: hypothetical protein IJQ98_05135, partial [Oscillospiraceae bacterium]|nr:hypothetical protein [Oscillospiraceae bacterium]
MDILGELQREKDKRQNTVSQDILGELQKEKDGAAAPAAPAPKSNGYAPMADLNRTTNGSGVTPASTLLRQTTQEIAATLPESRPAQTTRTHWDGTTRQRNDRGTMLREAIGKKYDTEGSIESGVERALALISGAGAAGINALSAVDSTLSADRKRVETAQNNLAAYTANRDQAKTAAERDRWQKLADAAQRQIDAYSGAAEIKRQNAGEAAASLESLRDKLIQAASEGDYNARAGRALETVEKYGDKRYTDDLKGLIGSNYAAGRLSQNSSYAWNEYLDNPTPENRRIAELYDLAIENSGENNAAALEADGFLQ